jgi:hypothetical protein
LTVDLSFCVVIYTIELDFSHTNRFVVNQRMCIRIIFQLI